MSYASNITHTLRETYSQFSSSFQVNCKEYLVNPACRKLQQVEKKYPQVKYLPELFSALAISYFPEKKVFCGVTILVGVNHIKPAFITDDLMKKILLGLALVVGSKTVLASVETFAKFALCIVLLGASYNYPKVKAEIKRKFVSLSE